MSQLEAAYRELPTWDAASLEAKLKESATAAGVKAAEFVKVCDDGAIDQAGAGDLFDGESFGNGEVVDAQLELRGRSNRSG